MNTLRNLLCWLRPLSPLHVAAAAAIYIPIIALLLWSISGPEPMPATGPARQMPADPPALPEGEPTAAPPLQVIPT